MRGLFVTGTDTGVGKTRVAAALCSAFVTRGKRVAGMKPIASGCEKTALGLRNEDALMLLQAMNVRASYAEVNPYAFEPAIAPHIAAADMATVIDFAVLDRSYQRLALQSDVVIVEGAGGWLAPLDATRCFADLAVHWSLDIVIVIGLRLGCLNHALLTAEAVERRGLRCVGWIGNAIEPKFERLQENLTTLQTRMPAPCLGVLPHAPHASRAECAAILAARLPE